MRRFNSSADIDSMPVEQRILMGEVRCVGLTRAECNEKAPQWGAVCCGNKSCLTIDAVPGWSAQTHTVLKVHTTAQQWWWSLWRGLQWSIPHSHPHITTEDG